MGRVVSANDFPFAHQPYASLLGLTFVAEGLLLEQAFFFGTAEAKFRGSS